MMVLLRTDKEQVHGAEMQNLHYAGPGKIDSSSRCNCCYMPAGRVRCSPLLATTDGLLLGAAAMPALQQQQCGRDSRAYTPEAAPLSVRGAVYSLRKCSLVELV
jgi:hypothetical protein